MVKINTVGQNIPTPPLLASSKSHPWSHANTPLMARNSQIIIWCKISVKTFCIYAKLFYLKNIYLFSLFSNIILAKYNRFIGFVNNFTRKIVDSNHPMFLNNIELWIIIILFKKDLKDYLFCFKILSYVSIYFVNWHCWLGFKANYSEWNIMAIFCT